MVEFTHTFIVGGNIQQIFDLVREHYTSLGYFEVFHDPPNQLNFSMGKKLAFSWKGTITEVYVSLLMQAGNVNVSVRYVKPTMVSPTPHALNDMNAHFLGEFNALKAKVVRVVTLGY